MAYIAPQSFVRTFVESDPDEPPIDVDRPRRELAESLNRRDMPWLSASYEHGLKIDKAGWDLHGLFCELGLEKNGDDFSLSRPFAFVMAAIIDGRYTDYPKEES